MKPGSIPLLVILAAAPPLVAGAASPWATRPDPEVYYRISADTLGLGASNSDTILVSRQVGANREAFWAAERWQTKKDVGKPLLKRHAWLDGRTCPALAAALTALADLPPAKIGGPSNFDQVGMVMDGGVITVSGPGPGPRPGSTGAAAEGRRGRIVTMAEHPGPIVRWYYKAEPALEACWQDHPRLSDGTVLKSRMNSDAEAERQKP